MSYTQTTSQTTLKPGSPRQKSEIVDRGLDVYMQAKASRHALKWGSINVVLLSILMFDISNKCPFAFSKWYYLEYAVTACLALSVMYYFGKYFYILFSFEPVKGTEAQRKLLQFGVGGRCCQNLSITICFNYSFLPDASFVTTPPSKGQKSAPKTPLNVTALSWHSSMNDCNYIALKGTIFKI